MTIEEMKPRVRKLIDEWFDSLDYNDQSVVIDLIANRQFDELIRRFTGSPYFPNLEMVKGCMVAK